MWLKFNSLLFYDYGYFNMTNSRTNFQQIVGFLTSLNNLRFGQLGFIDGTFIMAFIRNFNPLNISDVIYSIST